MSNQLAAESSPYLLQHKDNPVAWQPWGEDAFEKARREDKPLFVSIGYSTCHWCHVMERESFEDEEVADALNDAFVPVKVDREERPDVDSLYMSACQLMRKQGGWPLNVLLTPEGKPFHAETYLPKTSRLGRMGLLQLVERVRTLWQDERDKVTENADGLADALRRMSAPQQGGEAAVLGEDMLRAAYDALAERFDAAHGGFGSAPKFPTPHHLLFLLRYGHMTGEERATEMVKKTLDAMRGGGVFDQLGYGFHRYSTDEHWRLPHFEKMGYDQALLARAYTEGYQATGEERFRRTAEEIFDYVFRDLTSEDGAFFSAEDADSEGEEGTFYVWSTEEVREVLSEDAAALVIETFGLEEEGNFREESTGERTGVNVLHPGRPLDEAAAASDLDDGAFFERIEAAREKLFARREERPRPHRDDKVLTDWNGLMIAALANAARVFDDEGERYAEAAARAADFLLDTLRTDDGRLLHRYRKGEAGIRAHLDDYAFLSWGLTELYEATFEPKWLRAAAELADEMHERFADDEGGGYFLSAPDGGEELVARQKPLQDTAMPSGNAGALWAHLRLARLTGRTDFAERADRLMKGAAAQVRRRPSGFTALLCGVALATGPAREIVVSGDPADKDTQALLRVLRRRYQPNAVTLLRPPDSADGQTPEIADVAPFTEAQRPVDGHAAAYVCENHACRRPVTTPDELDAALDG
ncbi:MAG: thioredoxin domain-containing protein [Bacteroidetes bacterium QS_8_68_15]|nr:MAG: thioredoxin domain-containing protein [Bacteroidetes bacterium QS_8_68_15]